MPSSALCLCLTWLHAWLFYHFRLCIRNGILIHRNSEITNYIIINDTNTIPPGLLLPRAGSLSLVKKGTANLAHSSPQRHPAGAPLSHSDVLVHHDKLEKGKLRDRNVLEGNWRWCEM